MKQIDLRELYPDEYKTETLVMVSDEIWEEMEVMKKQIESARRKKYRYHAQYSLDAEDGIENDAVERVLTPEELIEYNFLKEEIYWAILQLPEKQAKRIYAYYYLDMTIQEIAQAEGVSKSRISESINRGLKNLERILMNRWK